MIDIEEFNKEIVKTNHIEPRISYRPAWVGQIGYLYFLHSEFDPEFWETGYLDFDQVGMIIRNKKINLLMGSI